MDESKLSARLAVRPLKDTDVPAILALCEGNPQYYRHCPPPVSADSIRRDMRALPPRTTADRKHYLGYFEGERLVAVLDLIERFPDDGTAFIGFFMLDADFQGKGVGSAVIAELLNALSGFGFSHVRLGWAQGNRHAERFWKRNGFRETGVVADGGGYSIVYASRSCQIGQRDSI